MADQSIQQPSKGSRQARRYSTKNTEVSEKGYQNLRTGNLCPRCNTIDFGAITDKHLRIPEEGLHVISLGRFNSKQSSCHLCDLFQSVATTYRRQYDFGLRLFDEIPGQVPGRLKDDSNTNTRFLAVLRYSKKLIYDSRIAHETGVNGLLTVTPNDSQLPHSVKLVDQEKVNYSLVSSWLDDCINSHTLACSSTTSKASDFQLHVIDCQMNKICLLPQNKQYVALSYVWGRMSPELIPETATEGSTDACLPDIVPLTIKHAILVVQSIGHRYLWVDRFCIPHKNSAERTTAMLNMNEIYAGAVLTIVSLHGDNANDGLPGVGEVPRKGRQQVQTRYGQLVSSFPPLKTAIAKSVWSKRGWTFQEGRLSRRCIFFTEKQTYFSCRTHTLSESLPDPDCALSAVTCLYFEGLQPSMFIPDSNMMFSGIFLDRLSYTQRTLTYQKDILNAFRGILRIHGFVTLWGVPVSYRGDVIDPAVCLTMGLLWVRRSLATFESHMPDTHTGSYERRLGFPTWSWASIVGEIFQFGTNETCTYRRFFRDEIHDRLDQLPPAIEVRLKRPELSLQDAVELATTNMLSELSPSLLIKGDLVRVKRELNPGVKAGKVGHVRYRFCDENDDIASDVYILPRIDLDEDDQDTSEAQDALILVNWRDGARKGQMRFILMLLRWVWEGVAERVGLLGRYYDKWTSTFLKRLHKRTVEFELQ